LLHSTGTSHLKVAAVAFGCSAIKRLREGGETLAKIRAVSALKS